MFKQNLNPDHTLFLQIKKLLLNITGKGVTHLTLTLVKSSGVKFIFFSNMQSIVKNIYYKRQKINIILMKKRFQF